MMELKVKMPANVKYELSETGMIKAESILYKLAELPNIKKINPTVMLRLDNLLVNDSYTIYKAQYDALTNEVILYLEKAHFCDMCGKFLHYNEEKKASLCYDCQDEYALSEDDLINNDIIECPKCGQQFSKNLAAISRTDNKTKICSRCGTNEALEAFTNHMKGNN